MTVLEIVQPPNPVLSQKGAKVTEFNLELQALIDNMIATMRDANGVGLAAPQIGQSLQLAVIETLPETDEEGNNIPDTRELFVIVNPEIIWHSRKVEDGIEGCLSIPGYVGEVERNTSIRVKAQDRMGRPINLRLADWDARIFQHEIDHLNGVLFTDRLTAPENFWTDEEYQEMVDEAYAELEAEQDTE